MFNFMLFNNTVMRVNSTTGEAWLYESGRWQPIPEPTVPAPATQA